MIFLIIRETRHYISEWISWRFFFPASNHVKISASSWGHIPVVQLLIERGCQYAARNNEGFTASDYAYS